MHCSNVNVAKLGHDIRFTNGSLRLVWLFRGLDSVNENWIYIASVYQEGDDKIIRIVKIAGLNRKSSQWKWLKLCKASFCLAESWHKYRSSNQIWWKKSNLGFCEFKQLFHAKSCNKALVIPTFHSTCKAYMIEKIMVGLIWWKLLACVCWRTVSLLMRHCRMWMLCLESRSMNYEQKTISIINAPFFLPVPMESIPSHANQLICEILEINFNPLLLTVTASAFIKYIVTIVTMQGKSIASHF